MVNIAKDAIKAGRGLIVIDYIDKCQLSDNIKAITPADKLLEIDCSNISFMLATWYVITLTLTYTLNHNIRFCANYVVCKLKGLEEILYCIASFILTTWYVN